MKIAFTSTDGRTVDTHFGNATDFYFWKVGPQTATELGKIKVTDTEGQEDRILLRAEALKDCALVCTVQIGGPAAAKLVARHVHPMKTAEGTPIAEFIAKMQEVLRGSPPPWLRKIVAAEAGAAV